jgi:hypothetical protein
MGLDFAELDHRRHLVMPTNHPYKTLLKYLDNRGVEQFADFEDYTKLPSEERIFRSARLYGKSTSLISISIVNATRTADK